MTLRSPGVRHKTIGFVRAVKSQRGFSVTIPEIRYGRGRA